VGVGTGALLCERLSRRQVEIGLVPLGAIGMSVFCIDLFFAVRHLPTSLPMDISAFVGHTAHWRVMVDLLLLSLFTGLYSVPMYAWVQLTSHQDHCARLIAATNILNALFMVASALIAGALLSAGLTIPEVMLCTGVANAVVTSAIFWVEPSYPRRFVAWLGTWA